MGSAWVGVEFKGRHGQRWLRTLSNMPSRRVGSRARAVARGLESGLSGMSDVREQASLVGKDVRQLAHTAREAVEAVVKKQIDPIEQTCWGTPYGRFSSPPASAGCSAPFSGAASRT